MKTITYAGDTFVTGDDIAAAVLAYARALARTGGADTIEIPVLGAEGEIGRATLLVGPASQIVAGPSSGAADDVRDADLVNDLTRRSDALEASPTAVPDPDGPDNTLDVDFDEG